MVKRVIGIDPGKNTGLAILERGLQAYNLDFWSAVDLVSGFDPGETAVVVELPRSKAVWHGRGQNSKATARTGVNVGAVVREAELLAARFESAGYQVITKHPAGKVSAKYVKAVTGYTGCTNEHTRDAIMLAWHHGYLISKARKPQRTGSE